MTAPFITGPLISTAVSYTTHTRTAIFYRELCPHLSHIVNGVGPLQYFLQFKKPFVHNSEKGENIKCPKAQHVISMEPTIKKE